MNGPNYSIEKDTLSYLQGKRTPKKSDLLPKRNTEQKIESNFVLLGNRNCLMKNKKQLQDWALENKVYYDNDIPINKEPHKQIVVSQCDTAIEETL